MRRILLFGLLLVVCGLALASAATLGVDGGAIQGFSFDVVIDLPTTTTTLPLGDLAGTTTPTS